MAPVCICTLVTDSYRAHGEVLARSAREQNPDAEVVVLRLETGPILELGLERRELLRLAAIYTVAELAGALKPYLIRHLLQQGADTVIFLDADTEVLAPLDLAVALASEHGVVLTPHITTPHAEFEPWFLLSGMLNAGFLAVGRDGGPFLDWWAARTVRHCHVAIHEGNCAEQRWLDFALPLFGAYVLRDPSYNVMGWNLHERPVPPVTFFHFCGGFDPHRTDTLATMPGLPWPSPDEYPAVAEICRAYAAKLLAAGYDDARRQPYRYGVTSDGVTLDPVIRRLYRESLLEAEAKGGDEPPNPFVEGARFVDWLLEPVGDTGLNRYLLGLHDGRADLRTVFADVPGADSARFIEWVIGEPTNRQTIPALFVPSADR